MEQVIPNGKRMYRNMSDAQKEKISASMKGRKLSDEHKEKISKGMENYWKNLPYRPINTNTDTDQEISDKNDIYNV